MQYAFITIYKVDSTALVHFRDAPTTITLANGLDFLQTLYFRAMFHLESHSSGCLQHNSNNQHVHLFFSSSDSKTSDKVLLPGGNWASLVLMVSSGGRQWSVSELQVGACGLTGASSRGSSSRLCSFCLFSHSLNCSCTESAMRRVQQTQKKEQRKKKVSPSPLLRCSRQSRPSGLTPHLS